MLYTCKMTELLKLIILLQGIPFKLTLYYNISVQRTQPIICYGQCCHYECAGGYAVLDPNLPVILSNYDIYKGYF